MRFNSGELYRLVAHRGVSGAQRELRRGTDSSPHTRSAGRGAPPGPPAPQFPSKKPRRMWGFFLIAAHQFVLYSITSSAMASSDGGTVRPKAFAVFRLMASSYLVGACTGRSAGLSPLRMRST